MGAEFLRIDIEEAGPSADGYAKETSADFDAKAAERTPRRPLTSTSSSPPP